MEIITVTNYKSPVGELIIGSFNDRICLFDWVESKRRPINEHRIRRKLKAGFAEGSSDIIDETIKKMDEYFSGSRFGFSVPVFATGTEFQCLVWSELTKIPYGETITYSELARRIGNPKAVRAVAAAVAANPVSILVPCHRVIGSNGHLTGYAGGIPAKKALLTLEKSLPKR